MSEYPGDIIVKGREFRDNEDARFEKSSGGAANEILEVIGGIAGIGVGGDQYYRRWETGDVPGGVFLHNTNHHPIVNGKPSSLHAQDGESVSVAVGGVFLFNTRLAASQTITKGDALEPLTATPYLQAQSAGPTVARANETITTTGAGEWTTAWNLINVT